MDALTLFFRLFTSAERLSAQLSTKQAAYKAQTSISDRLWFWRQLLQFFDLTGA